VYEVIQREKAEMSETPVIDGEQATSPVEQDKAKQAERIKVLECNLKAANKRLGDLNAQC